jgi:hypothetical protein
LLASDEPSFLWFVRWGVMFEAGWELFDTIKNVVPSVFAGKPNLNVVIPVFHHVCLYIALPANILMVDGPCGRELAWLLVICAGIVGPVGMLNFTKTLCDWDVPWERVLAQLITVVTCGTFIVRQTTLLLSEQTPR